MRSAALGLAVAMAVGLGILTWRASVGQELDAVRLGIATAGPVATLDGRRELCQRPIDLDRPVPRLGLGIFQGPQPGPELRVRINDLATGDTLQTVTVPESWGVAPGQYFGLELPEPLPADRGVEVCVRNQGKRPVELFGKQASSVGNLYEGEENVSGDDWAIFFPLVEEERRSHLEMIPDFLQRASVLRPGIVGAATYGILFALLLVGAPLLLWRAISRAAAED